MTEFSVTPPILLLVNYQHLIWHIAVSIVFIIMCSTSLVSLTTLLALRTNHLELLLGDIFGKINVAYISNKILITIIWGQSWRRSTKCDCKTDWLWVRSPLGEFALVSRQSAAWISATQNAKPLEFDGKWTTECFNTRFPRRAGIQCEAVICYSMYLDIYV